MYRLKLLLDTYILINDINKYNKYINDFSVKIIVQLLMI